MRSESRLLSAVMLSASADWMVITIASAINQIAASLLIEDQPVQRGIVRSILR